MIFLLALFVILFVASPSVGAIGEFAKQRFDWVIAKKLTVTNDTDLQGAIDFDGAATFNSTVDVDGNVTSGTGAFTITDNVLIDGQADAVQLTVQGNGTQTSNVFEVENSAGTAKAVIDNTGEGTFAGGVHLSGDGTGWMIFGVQTAISMTAGSTITPTGTWQPLESGSAITSSATTAVADGTTSGDVLIMQNTNASDVIIIDGTGANVECKANVSLGAGDTITLVWNGTNWYCLSVYDNS